MVAVEGREAAVRFLEAHFEQLAARLEPELEGANPVERMAIITRARTEDGYMAEGAATFCCGTLTEHHCAIRAVSADEIALFQTLTWLRRFGRSGPESILNAPEHQPIIDVATKTGFLLLQDQPREVVIGAIVVRPPGTSRPNQFAADDYKQLALPGFAKATMTFRIEEQSGGMSRVVTETRVFATDRAALGRFTPYWRVIFPGSAILRITWLRAIKARAERAS